jgi:hypothetical protein
MYSLERMNPYSLAGSAMNAVTSQQFCRNSWLKWTSEEENNVVVSAIVWYYAGRIVGGNRHQMSICQMCAYPTLLPYHPLENIPDHTYSILIKHNLATHAGIYSIHTLSD